MSRARFSQAAHLEASGRYSSKVSLIAGVSC
jgi:hypothetical protein